MRTGFVLSSVHAFGYIPELQRMGPVIPACNFPAGVIYNLVHRGYEVYEHNPIDQKIKVRLTLENFNDTNKFAGYVHTEPAVQVEEKKIETPSNAEVILTNNSGIEVPIETIVSPIIICGIWNFLAISLAPSTKKSAPFISNKKPKTINNTFIIILFNSLYNIFIYIHKIIQYKAIFSYF